MSDAIDPRGARTGRGARKRKSPEQQHLRDLFLEAIEAENG
ncbi:MAG: hypothetical protein ACFCUT_04280 [Kiloniellaceae bacterium]